MLAVSPDALVTRGGTDVLFAVRDGKAFEVRVTRGEKIGDFFADFIVDDTILLELKATGLSSVDALARLPLTRLDVRRNDDLELAGNFPHVRTGR